MSTYSRTQAVFAAFTVVLLLSLVFLALAPHIASAQQEENNPYFNCTWAGVSVLHGQSRVFYSASSVTAPASCSSYAQTRTCSYGRLDGSDAYAYASCTQIQPAVSCTLDGVTVPGGQPRTFYSAKTVTSPAVCASVAQTRTCTNGALSGSTSYQYAACAQVTLPSLPPPTPTPTPSPAPTASVTANGQHSLSVTPGTQYTIAWSSTNAASCSVTWNGTYNGTPSSGTQAWPTSGGGSTALIGSYTITCANSAGVTASDSVTITAASTTPPPPPPPSPPSVPTARLGIVDSIATEGAVADNGQIQFFTTGVGPLNINYTVSGGSYTSDYTLSTGNVGYMGIPSGGTYNNLFLYPRTNNATYEGSKTITFTISPNAAYTIGSPSSVTVTVNDDDLPAQGKLTIAQIQNVVDLLNSFKTDQASVSSVRNILQNATVLTGAPVITTAPGNVAVAPGATYVWQVIATGTTPLSYQWQKQNASGGWDSIPLAGDWQFGISNIQVANAGVYRVEVKNSAATVDTAPFTLTVNVPVNLVVNGDFSAGAVAGGATTTTNGVAIADHWYGGPGSGATAHYEVMQESGASIPRYLRIKWTAAPTSGEGQHLPAFRFTFLEGSNYTGDKDKDVRQFYGKTVEFSFYARVAGGSINLVPIIWQSWDSQTSGVAGVKGSGYQLFESSGTDGVVKVAQGAPGANARVTVTTQWQKFTKRITIPDSTGKTLSVDAYTGFGLDFDNAYGPTLDVAHFEAHFAGSTAKTPSNSMLANALTALQSFLGALFGWSK